MRRQRLETILSTDRKIEQGQVFWGDSFLYCLLNQETQGRDFTFNW